jgi:hypothetical protein
LPCRFNFSPVDVSTIFYPTSTPLTTITIRPHTHPIRVNELHPFIGTSGRNALQELDFYATALRSFISRMEHLKTRLTNNRTLRNKCRTWATAKTEDNCDWAEFELAQMILAWFPS